MPRQVQFRFQSYGRPMTLLRSTAFPLLFCAAFAFLAGCGSQPAPVSESNEQPAADQQLSEPSEADSSTSDTPAASANSSEPALVHQKGGKTWIGDVPVDVWFDDPLAVASTGGEIAPSQSPPPAQVAEPGTPEPRPTPDPMPMSPAAGGIDWKRVIPGELLDGEVTTIRNRFAADLQTVGSYNSSYLGLPPHIVTLAVLAHIAEQHPDDIRWKKNAKYIKHLAGQMNAEKLRTGPSSQKPLKEKFDSVVEILSGSVPATLEPPPENESLQDVAKIAYLMKRLENASKLITTNGGTAEAMTSNAGQLKQEAAVLGALTQSLLDGYEDYADDEIFEGFVNNMVEATVNMREHIQNDEFGKFELDVSAMNKACQDCHGTYR